MSGIQSTSFLSIHTIQHPDAAGGLRGGDHQPVLRERKPKLFYGFRNHQVGVVQCGYRDGLAYWTAFPWIALRSERK